MRSDRSLGHHHAETIQVPQFRGPQRTRIARVASASRVRILEKVALHVHTDNQHAAGHRHATRVQDFAQFGDEALRTCHQSDRPAYRSP